VKRPAAVPTRLFVAAAAMAALAPSTAFASPQVSFDYLRATLPGPVELGWLEAPVGAGDYLDGPMTLATIRAYYMHYKQTEAFITTALRPLVENGFVNGYAKAWYRVNTTDDLTEQVAVFPDSSAALSAFTAQKENTSADPSFQSFFDTGLPEMSFGVIGVLKPSANTSYYLAGVAFVKGNALYAASAGLPSLLTADKVMPQARALEARAPSSIPTFDSTPQVVQPRVATPLVSPALLIGAAVSALVVIALVAVLTLWLVRPSPRPAVAVALPVTPPVAPPVLPAPQVPQPK